MFNVNGTYYYHTYSIPTHLTTQVNGVFGNMSHECGVDIDKVPIPIPCSKRVEYYY